MKKNIIFKFNYYLSTLWLRITSEISLFFLTSFFIVECRGMSESESFGRFFVMKDKLELILDERLIKYANGTQLKNDLAKWG